jgi:hypothetical protein
VQVTGYCTTRFALHRNPVATIARSVRQRIRAHHGFVAPTKLDFDRKMLPRREIRERFTAFGFEDERHDIGTLPRLLDESQIEKGVGLGMPSQRQRLFECETNQSTRTRMTLDLLRIPVDLRPTRQLQHAPRLEIDEDQSRERIEDEIADRVVVVVARIIRDDQRAIVHDFDETGRAPAMRGIHSEGDILSFVSMARGNEEGVGRPNASD